MVAPRKRREREREQKRRVQATRNDLSDQAAGQNSQFRTTAMGMDPDNPLHVSITDARDQFFTGLTNSLHGTKGQATAAGGVNLTGIDALNQAAQSMANQMLNSVQMLKQSRAGLDTSLDGLADAIDDFVNQQKGRYTGTGTPGQGGPTGGQPNAPQGPPGAPAGPPPAQHPAPPSPGPRRPPQRPAHPFATRLDDILNQQDPQKRLRGERGVFGGANDYWDAISRGEDPETGLGPARNHPTSMHELRQVLGTRLGRRLHTKMGLGREDQPYLRPNYDQDNALTGYTFNDGSGVEETIAPDDNQRLQAAQSHVNSSITPKKMMATRVASSLATKAGFAGLGRAIPVVGWAATALQAGNEIAEEATNQRAKNAYYQNIYGGSNAAGFADRLGEEATVLSERFRFGMDEDMTRRVYKGVSQLGYDGEKRDRGVDFISNNYKRYGMDEQQSLTILAAAANGANQGLTGVAKSLDTVTKRAKTMGMNVGQLTETFVQNFARITEQGGGSGAGPLAGALTMTGQGSARGMENFDLSSLTSDSMIRMLGATGGRTFNEQQSRMRTDPAGYGRDIDQYLTQYESGLSSAQYDAAVKQKFQERGGQAALAKNPNMMREIVQELEDSGIHGPDQEVLKQIYSQAVPSMANSSSEDAAVFYAQRQIDPNATEHAAQQMIESSKPRAMNDEEKANHSDWSMSPRTYANGRQEGWGEHFWDQTFGGLFGSRDTAEKTAYDIEGDSGMKNPVFDQLVKAGADDHENLKVEVDTKNGKRLVDLTTAMREYGDQVTSGKAKFVDPGGEWDNQKVSDVTGGMGDPNTQITSNQRDAEAEGDETYEEKDVRKDAAEDNGGDGGTTTVELSDDAKKLLKLLPPSGEETSENAAGAGAPTAPTGTPTVKGDG